MKKRLATAKRTSHKNPSEKKAGGPLEMIEADKMSASLTNEQLAIKVRDGFAAFRPQLEQWLPLAIELRSRFDTMRRANHYKEILGCTTWEKFCAKRLGYSNRHIRRLMEGQNAASSKYQNTTKRGERPKPLTDSVAATREASLAWTDDKYIRTCVHFVMSTLRSLEKSDPRRFHRIAVAIAREIAGDFLGDESEPGDPE